MTNFTDKVAALMSDVVETNESLSDGVAALLVGQRVVAASAEVWSSDGEWSITLRFDDGSAIRVPGETRATGPLADLIRMAGGDPGDSE
jgi:hypothetical protein